MVTPDQKTLLVNSRYNSAVYAYSLPDLKLLGGTDLGGRADWVTFTPDSKSIYIATENRDAVVVIDVASNKVVTKAYPGFAGLVKRSIESSGTRPLSPAYQDVSLAIQDTLHPASSVDPTDPGSTYDALRSSLQDAVERKGLF